MAQVSCDLSSSGYTVQKWVGHCFNGLGDVFTARGNDASRVTVKRISIDAVPDPTEIAKEVHLLRSLNHPNIIKLHAAFVCKDSMLLATPTCTLGSALDVILSSYPHGIPEKAIALMLSQLLSAVVYVHGQGILHRSIRASHLLLDATGCLRLAGFRCAIKLRTDRSARLTDFERNLEGSLLWLAPEVLAQDLNGYDERSDIYSIGITLCELANGFPPFSDMDPLQMLYEKGRGTTPKLLDRSTLPVIDDTEHARRDLSEAFHDITEQCLKANQFHRPFAAGLVDHPFLRSKKKSKKTVIESLPMAKRLEDVQRVSERTPPACGTYDIPEWS